MAEKVAAGWRERALAEIGAIKPFWMERYGWRPLVRGTEDRVDLFVRFRRPKTGDTYVLRLSFESDFQTAGRRESFVNPENLDEEGPEFWPAGINAIKNTHNPPAICLEGTWGFHSVLHKERDGRRSSLNRLLMEIQQCLKQ